MSLALVISKTCKVSSDNAGINTIQYNTIKVTSFDQNHFPLNDGITKSTQQD